MESRSLHAGVPAARTSCGGAEPEAIAMTGSEVYQMQLARAHRRTGGVPPERLVASPSTAVMPSGPW